MTGFARAGRLARGAPVDLTVAQAERLGFPAAARVEKFTRDLERRGALKSLLRAHRGRLALYCVAGLGVVALGPAVPALVGRVAAHLRAGAVTPALAAWVVGAVALAAALRWLSTWLVRALLYQMTTLLKLAIFARLQRVDPAWTAEAGRSVSTLLVTAPQQVAQVAFVAEFAVNTALVLVLTGYLSVVFGGVGLAVAALVGVLVAGWLRLVRRETRAMHGYLEHGHRRVALVDTVTRHWASIARQQWSRPVLDAAERARDGQFAALRSAARPGAALAALAGGGTALVCLAAVVLAGDLAEGLALLLTVQLLIAAVNENMSTYASVAWARTMTADVESLFREAPLIVPAATAPRPGERIVVLGDSVAVRTYLDELPGRVAVVARNEPELDGTLTDNVTLWRGTEAGAELGMAAARAGLGGLLAARGDDGLATGQRRLSDGEGVRLSVARAWLSAPDVLVVEDALSALDPVTAASVSAGIFGAEDGPARVYAGTRTDPAGYADTVVLAGVEVWKRADVTVDVLRRHLPEDEARRWAAALAVDAPRAGIRVTPLASRAREGVLDGVGLELDVAPPRLAEAATRLADLYPRRVLALIAVLLTGLVVTELAVAGTLGASRVNLAALAALAVAALVGESALRFALVRGSMPATRRLHRRILEGMLGRGLPDGSATAAGRFTDDFTTAELWSSGILLRGVRAVLATAASFVAMVLAAPVSAIGILILAVLAVVRYPALRRDAVRGRALLAATRGPLRTYAAAVLTCRSFTFSSALRPAFAARFRDLLAMEHAGLYAAHGTRMAVVASVEAAGVLLFVVTVAGAAWAPPGWTGLLAVAVYASYAIGSRFAALVEAHQEVDGTTQVLARVFALLPSGPIPQAAVEDHGLAVAGKLTVLRGASGAGKSTLLRTVPGRLVENEPPPLPIPLDELCSPEALALASRWSAALGTPVRRQLVALAVACADEPDVLLIDETTSAFTPADERQVLTIVREHLPEAAIVAVLHRPDNLDLADRVVEL